MSTTDDECGTGGLYLNFVGHVGCQCHEFESMAAASPCGELDERSGVLDVCAYDEHGGGDEDDDDEEDDECCSVNQCHCHHQPHHDHDHQRYFSDNDSLMEDSDDDDELDGGSEMDGCIHRHAIAHRAGVYKDAVERGNFDQELQRKEETLDKLKAAISVYESSPCHDAKRNVGLRMAKMIRLAIELVVAQKRLMIEQEKFDRLSMEGWAIQSKLSLSSSNVFRLPPSSAPNYKKAESHIVEV